MYCMILNSVSNLFLTQMPVILLLELLFLTQMPVILLLELCTHRRRMVKKEWKHFQGCPKIRLFNDTIEEEHLFPHQCFKSALMTI